MFSNVVLNIFDRARKTKQNVIKFGTEVSKSTRQMLIKFIIHLLSEVMLCHKLLTCFFMLNFQ